MDLQLLKAFVKVAEVGGFTRAAEALHLTQPTLSGQIARLEHELGRSLFDRTARGVRLTDAGAVFLSKVGPLLTQLEEAKAAIAHDPTAGRLTVAAIPTIAPYLLPPALTRFAAEYPKARLEVMELTTADTLKHLTDGAIDLAVLALPVADDTVYAEHLFDEELMLALPPKHRLTRAAEVTFDSLSDEAFILLHDAHCLTGQLLGFCTRQKLAPLVTARIHQLATVLELVKLGHGVSFVPKMAVGPQSGCVFRSLTADRPTRTVGMVCSRSRFRSPLHTAFCQILRATVGKEAASH